MPSTEFRLPDVGEGLTEAVIVTWRVGPGDTVAVNDILVEIETAKSIVDLPSPAAGTISEISVPEGATAQVGEVLVTITTGAAPAGARDGSSVTDPDEEPRVLVGTGPSAAPDRRRRLRPRGVSSQGSATAVVGPTAPRPFADPRQRPRAKPPVRQLARTLGVDLNDLATTTPGVITREQVEIAAKNPPVATPSPAEGRETRIPITGHRKATAAAMVRSAFTAPHVTEFLTVDVTSTMELLARLKADREWRGVRLTPLTIVARCLVLAIRRHPGVNSRWDDETQQIVRYPYVNLGIAAATPRGLIVPNIKNADQLDLTGLASGLEELVQTARAGRTSPEQMSGGTITITNIGSFGVDTGTPILNPGEAAILAFGAVRQGPWVVNDQVVPRQLTQLALSFDHRLVDGELGSRVLAEVGQLLHDPGLALTF